MSTKQHSIPPTRVFSINWKLSFTPHPPPPTIFTCCTKHVQPSFLDNSDIAKARRFSIVHFRLLMTGGWTTNTIRIFFTSSQLILPLQMRSSSNTQPSAAKSCCPLHLLSRRLHFKISSTFPRVEVALEYPALMPVTTTPTACWNLRVAWF